MKNGGKDRVALTQLVRFLVVELTHTDSNPKFDISVVFTANYFLVGGDIPVDNETFLVTDFVNFKIKPVPSFGGAHRGRICLRVFIRIGARAEVILQHFHQSRYRSSTL
jgi:hypothetical protein